MSATSRGAVRGKSTPLVANVTSSRVDPSVVRVVLAGAAVDPDRAVDALGAITSALVSQGVKGRVLLTPAGFMRRTLAARWDGTYGWSSTSADFEGLAEFARTHVTSVLPAATRNQLAEVIDECIFGVDVWDGPERAEPHGEVAISLVPATGVTTVVTGKTFPTTQQQDVLIRNPDTGSHFNDDPLSWCVTT